MLSWITLVAPEKMMLLLFCVHLRLFFFSFFFFSLKFVDFSFSSVQKAYILFSFFLFPVYIPCKFGKIVKAPPLPDGS